MAYARGNGFIGCPENYTPEVKAKMRAKKLGKKQTPEHVAKCVAARTGLKRTPEQCENMRKAALTRKPKPPITDETRQKLRDSVTESWKTRRKEK